MSTPQPIRIAFLGPHGTFTEQAVLEFLRGGHVPEADFSGAEQHDTGHSTEHGTEQGSSEALSAAIDAGQVVLAPQRSPADALDVLRAGDAEYAVIALESSVDGPVAQAEDALVRGERVQIQAELLVPISFAIGVRPGEAPAVTGQETGQDPTQQPTTPPVFSTHPVAEAQVREWVAENLPEVQFSAASSNAAAAQAVAEGKADICAAPARALDLYGLEMIAEGVADVAAAFTRFVLVSRPTSPGRATGSDRTGVAFTARHDRPGSLLSALQQLSVRGVNLTRISSRPTRELLGTYVFHMEMIGHIRDAPVADALAGLQRESSWIRFLGSWPLATAPRGVEEADMQEILGNVSSPTPDFGPSQQWLMDMIEPTET